MSQSTSLPAEIQSAADPNAIVVGELISPRRRSRQSAKARPGRRRKPKIDGLQAAKPRPDFPLSVHKSGRWYKSIRGRKVFFGYVRDGWEPALEWYNANAVDLHNGVIQQPRPRDRADPNAPTVYDLCKQFMDAKDVLLGQGRLAYTTHRNYRLTCRRLIKHFGEDRLLNSVSVDDWTRLYRQWARLSLTTLHALITRVQVMCVYAHQSKMITARMEFGPEFKRPSKQDLRKAKRGKPKRVMQPEELRTIIAKCDPQMKAMVLLGLNGGFGPSDLGQMTFADIDWQRNRVAYDRPKTGGIRRFPLWPETAQALRAAIAIRRKPLRREDDELVFISQQGNSYHKDHDSSNPISERFRRLLVRLGLYREGASFYSLRHTFESVAETCRDIIAVKVCLGHVDGSMTAEYRDIDVAMGNERLLLPVNTVRNWLYGLTESPTILSVSQAG